jgi:hypothetical protein
MMIIDKANGEVWQVRIVPQCMTDIIIQVARGDDEDEPTLFGFHLGELIRETLEPDGCHDGSYSASATKRLVLSRMARLLELQAETIRAVLAWPDKETPSENS